MGIDFLVGPAVDVTEIAMTWGKDEDAVLYEDCGLPHDPRIDAILDDMESGILDDGYLDELFYAYAFDHLPQKYGVERVFSYHQVAATGHWLIYCDAHEVYNSKKPFEDFIKIFRDEFGEDVEVQWFETTRW